MIKFTTEKHTVSWLLRKSIGNALDFTIAIQRKEVWDDMHKSNLIASVLLGVPIESLLFEEDGEDGYLVLDAKQRSLTLISFLKDGFSISDKCKVSKIDGVDIIGKKFSELSQDMQEKIKECELPISTLRPLTEDEREIVFFMRNQQVPLSKMELIRSVLGSRALEIVEKLTAHNFMTKINLSTSKTNRYQDLQVILEIMMHELDKDCSHSGSDLTEFAKEIREAGVSKELMEKVFKVFSYMDEAFTKKVKALRKVHVSTMYVVGKRAFSDGVAPKTFDNWVMKFFADIKGNDNEYNQATDSGVNQKQNIKKRIAFALKHYEENIHSV
jgi:hypothetical protein